MRMKLTTLEWVAIIVMALGLVAGISWIQDTIEERDDALHTIEMLELELEMQGEIDSLKFELIDLHELSFENIEYWIDTLGIEHKDVVMSQIRLETGDLTSDICTENHNLFGMKEPRVRETTALGTKRGHAYYGNYIDSIKDYKLWQDNMYGGGDYYAFLSNVGYAEATHYVRTLKSI